MAVLGAACGDDGGDPPAGQSPASPQATTSPTETAAAGVDCPGFDNYSSIERMEFGLWDNYFDERCAQFSPSTPFSVRNQGDVPHTFTLPDANVDLEVAPGEVVESPSPLPAEPGDYLVYCRFHGTPEGTGMAGIIRVA